MRIYKKRFAAMLLPALVECLERRPGSISGLGTTVEGGKTGGFTIQVRDTHMPFRYPGEKRPIPPGVFTDVTRAKKISMGDSRGVPGHRRDFAVFPHA